MKFHYYFLAAFLIVTLSLMIGCFPNTGDDDDDNDDSSDDDDDDTTQYTCEEYCQMDNTCFGTAHYATTTQCEAECELNFPQSQIACAEKTLCDQFAECMGDSLDDDDDDNDDDDDDNDDTVGFPQITANSPENNSDEHPLAVKVSLTFSKAMNHALTEAAFVLNGGTQRAIAGTFTWSNGDKKLTFTPESDLEEDTPYSVVMGTGAQDQDGYNLESLYTFNFTTVDLWTKEVTSVLLGVALDNDGNVYVTGELDSDLIISIYDKHGVEEESWTYDNDVGNDAGHDITLDPEGNIYVTGFKGIPGWDIFVAKYAGPDDLVWEDTAGDPSLTDYGQKLVYDSTYSEGRLFVSGRINSGSTDHDDLWVRSYRPDSTVNWTVVHDHDHNEDGGWGLAVVNDTTIAVAGYIDNFDSVWESDIFLGYLRKSDGYMTGTDSYSSGDGDDIGYDVAVDSDQKVYMTGSYARVSGESDIWVHAVDQDWTTYIDGDLRLKVTEVDEGRAIEVFEDKLIVAGSISNDGCPDYFLCALDKETGNEIWRQEGANYYIYTQAYDMAIDPNGNIYLVIPGEVADRNGKPDSYCLIKKFDINGNNIPE